ncbi:ABC transporter ATP-binding protein [Thiospirochaeta perfilievii]|uniref:ABC transporter ATP-binding protein n=1 Tax=Thiospirochaeta perfilievii TaxID=252967 RepID=A0A5C1QE56_9SPIO|nr:ABC transporter ATP-binding protein [Thiospirochaeta perfilievii]
MLKRFTNYYKPHKRIFFIDLFCALSIAIIDLLYPAFTRTILQDILPEGNLNSLFTLLALLLGLYIIRCFLDFVVLYWGHIMGVYMESDMRRDLFNHLQKLPFKFYDNNRTGELMSRVVNDLNEVSELAHHGPEDIFLSVVMLLGSFIYLVQVEWHLAVLIFCIMIPLILWFTITRRSSLGKSWATVRVKMGEINSSLENSIAGIRVARAFTNELFEKLRFNKSNNDFRGAKRGAYKSMAHFHVGVTFLMTLLNIVVLAVGGYMVFKESIDIPDLLAFMLYINLVIEPIKRFTGFTQQYEKGMAGFRRFCDIMDQEPDIIDRDDAIELINPKGNIELNNVTFSYDDENHILSDINLHIPSGKTVAIVGPTGAGKTTLCHLIPRFYEVNSGCVNIDGIDIRDTTLSSLRKSVGFVQQDVFLFTGTIKENILYGRPDATDSEIKEAALKAEIDDFITSLDNGYDTWIGEKGILLSGGQKQRLAIARAFLKNPPILILDEATSALDNQTERKIQKALEELSRGRTTLVIAHRLSTVRHADKIVVLTTDGIEDQGTHDELFDRDGLYRNLYNSQFV